jgi:type III secretion protein R
VRRAFGEARVRRCAKRFARSFVGAAALLALVLAPALAEAAARASGAPDGGGASSSGPLVVLGVMAALSLVPFLLLMGTAFVKVSVVLSILRSAVGGSQIPPTSVVTGLALILTLFIMAPTGQRMLAAVEPVLGAGAVAGAGAVSDLASPRTVDALTQAGARAGEPLREFLQKHADRRDRAAFLALAQRMRPAAERAAVGDRDLTVLLPAFVTSELRRAFEIGFLLFLPFLVIELVIANLLAALGMHMLTPTTVSLPFKLLLFVLADGWHLVTRGLVESYL